MAEKGLDFENIAKLTSNSESASKNYYLVVLASLEHHFLKTLKTQPFFAQKWLKMAEKDLNFENIGKWTSNLDSASKIYY